MKKILVLAAVVAVGFAVNASAFTFEQSKLTLSAMPFYSMPTGDMGDVVDNALGFGIGAEYLVQDNIKVGLEMGYVSYGAADDIEALDSDYDMSILNIGPTAKYFVTRDMLTFYGVAGIEFYNWTSAKIANLVPETDGTDLGFNLGAGVGYEINKNITGGAELRYHTVGGDLEGDFINLGFKFDYKF